MLRRLSRQRLDCDVSCEFSSVSWNGGGLGAVSSSPLHGKGNGVGRVEPITASLLIFDLILNILDWDLT
jgi:hypothetical protein